MKNLNFAKFRDDVEGSITAFLLIMFLIMIVAGGMAVDFMRHESERVLFQDVLDRAVLATASFDSEHESEAEIKAVIESHLEAAGYNLTYLEDLLIYADVSDATRRVDVSANFEIRTFFLRIMNKPTLTLAARSTAETKRSELELSLVVDISWSMNSRPRGSDRSDPKKIDALKDAASAFIDMLFASTEDAGITTMSIVPFSAQVATSREMATQFAGLVHWHDYSYCFDFAEEDFSRTDMPQTRSFMQAQNFRPRGIFDTSFRWCPRERNQIYPFSNSPTKLKGAISDLYLEAYTSVWLGAKWGAALLDPSLQPVLSGMSTIYEGGEPLVHPDFVGRPGDWNDPQTVKYLVIMTDGLNTHHRFMTPEQFNHENTEAWNSSENADYWEANAQISDCRANRDRWGNITNGCEAGGWGAGGGVWDSQNILWDNTEPADPQYGYGDERLESVCDAAKYIDPTTGDPLDASGQHRMVIYTIGFDVPEGGGVHQMMLDCASEPSKYYHAEDATELLDAFAAIAASIQKLKLVVN